MARAPLVTRGVTRHVAFVVLRTVMTFSWRAPRAWVAGLARVALASALGGVVAFGAGVALAAGDGAPRLTAGHAWLGVAMDNPVVRGGGVQVRHVVRGSPAEKAGIRDGDAITALDGARVAGPDDVSRIVSGRAPGDEVTATVKRLSKVLAIRVALGDRPTSDQMLRMDHVGEVAPAWKGVEPIGAAPASVAALRGRVVLVDFWATWCAACRVLAPTLSGWQARYGAQGLSVVGITTEAAEDAALFAERTGMKYGMVIDAKGETSRAYSVAALPTLFVVDKRGVVRDVAIGYDPMREEQIEQLVKQLLAEPSPRD